MKYLNTFLFCLTILMAHSQTIDIEIYATGFNQPLGMANAGDGRLFVLEKPGLIQIIDENGNRNSTPFLNIDPLVINGGGETGLLGLAFHPDYDTNGYFYVNYSNNNGDNVISRFSRSESDPDIADPSSELQLLTISQPYTNHNGGNMAFGPDGYLYIASGDGGSGGDPGDRAQSLTTLLGKMLRIDVDNTSDGNNYAIPSSNPFFGSSTEMQEIWAYGLRNPWRFSFDRLTNDLWIADVGQSTNEEINMVASTEAGVNYGWRCYEGNSNYNQSGNCPPQNTMTFPIAQYTHNNSGIYKCSITGGYRYRGTQQTSFEGLYFFADFCSNEIGFLSPSGEDWELTFSGPFNNNGWTSFGEDVNGELFIIGIESGNVYRIIDPTLGIDENETFNVSLYPNPTKNELTVKSSNPLSKIQTISIYDLQGQLIQTVSISDSSIETIQISNLSSGMYLANITDSNGISTMKKFVKN